MRKHIQYFNIVEIALALAIVGIGAAGIMSLFPVALNASRDAIGDSNAPDVAEQFYSWLQGKLKVEASTDWSTSAFLTGIPSSKPTPDGFEITSSTTHFENIYYSGTSGLYKVMQASGSVTDFSAIVKVWKADVLNVYINGSHYDLTSGNGGNKYATSIYMEISWPAEKPYDTRERRVYYLELFNLNAVN